MLVLVFLRFLKYDKKRLYQPIVDPSTSACELPGKKGKVGFHCWLCKGIHHIHLFPHMGEASKFLEKLTISQQQLPTSYLQISLNLPLVNEVIDLIQSTINPTLPLESETNIT